VSFFETQCKSFDNRLIIITTTTTIIIALIVIPSSGFKIFKVKDGLRIMGKPQRAVA